MKTMFNLNSFTALIAAIKTSAAQPDQREIAKEDMAFLKSLVRHVADYVHFEATLSTELAAARLALDAAEYRRVAEDLFESEAIHFGGCMASVGIINRFAGLYETSPIFNGNAESVTDVRACAIQLVDALYGEAKDVWPAALNN